MSYSGPYRSAFIHRWPRLDCFCLSSSFVILNQAEDVGSHVAILNGHRSRFCGSASKFIIHFSVLFSVSGMSAVFTTALVTC